MKNIITVIIIALVAVSTALSMQDMRVAYYTTNTNPQDVQLKVVDYTNGGAGQELFAGDVFNGLTPNDNGIVVAELKDFLPQQQQQGQQWSAINANVINTFVTVDIYVDGTLYAQYRLDQLVLDQAQVGVFDNDGNFPPPLVTSTLGTDDDRWADLFVLGNSVHIGPNGGLAGNDELSFSYDDGTNTATFTSANNDFMTVVNDDVTFADQITVDGIGFGQGSGDIISNISIGVDALVSNTNGNATTAIGYQSLQANTTGGANTALGTNTLQNNISGAFNTATGADALRFNTSGSNNTANGIDALRANTTASNNTAFGYRSLRANTTGTSNTSVGSDALLLNTTGIRNTALGALTLADNTSGGYNIAIGFESATNNTTGDANVALGDAALHKNTTGDFNTALGSHALHEVTASGNVGIGRYAGNFIGSGTNNILIGNEAGNGNSQKADAVGSIAIGYQAYTLGDNSIAIGQGVNTTADNQVVIGNSSILENNFYGRIEQRIGSAGNTALGTNALNTTLSGDNNTAVGVNALDAATSGGGNTAIGYSSLTTNSNFGNNTSVGANSLQNSNGDGNTALGRNAGNDLTSGNSNVFVGYNAGENASQATSVTNSIAIGAETFTTANHQVVIGNENITQTQLNGVLHNDVVNINDKVNLPAVTTSIVNYTQAGQGNEITTVNMPGIADGSIIFIRNGTGNPVDILNSNGVAPDALVTCIRIGGTWYASN